MGSESNALRSLFCGNVTYITGSQWRRGGISVGRTQSLFDVWLLQLLTQDCVFLKEMIKLGIRFDCGGENSPLTVQHILSYTDIHPSIICTDIWMLCGELEPIPADMWREAGSPGHRRADVQLHNLSHSHSHLHTTQSLPVTQPEPAPSHPQKTHSDTWWTSKLHTERSRWGKRADRCTTMPPIHIQAPDFNIGYYVLLLQLPLFSLCLTFELCIPKNTKGKKTLAKASNVSFDKSNTSFKILRYHEIRHVQASDYVSYKTNELLQISCVET